MQSFSGIIFTEPNFFPTAFKAAWKRLSLLDMREPHEYEIAKIPGSTLIPLGKLPERLGELDKGAKLIVHCKMGGRSAKAVQLLREKGYDATNVTDGINAWSESIDPSVPQY